MIGASDIVITATGASAPILTKARIENIMRPRRNQPLFVIDIALPRDVEAAAGEIEQVFLHTHRRSAGHRCAKTSSAVPARLLVPRPSSPTS